MYSQPPALSRKDNQTLICPDCGVDEALDDLFATVDVDYDVKQQARKKIHDVMKQAGCGNGSRFAV